MEALNDLANKNSEETGILDVGMVRVGQNCQPFEAHATQTSKISVGNQE